MKTQALQIAIISALTMSCISLLLQLLPSSQHQTINLNLNSATRILVPGLDDGQTFPRRRISIGSPIGDPKTTADEYGIAIYDDSGVMVAFLGILDHGVAGLWCTDGTGAKFEAYVTGGQTILRCYNQSGRLIKEVKH